MKNLYRQNKDRKTLKILEHFFQAAVLGSALSTVFFYIQSSYVFAIATVAIYSTVLPIAIALTLINLYLQKMKPSNMMENITGMMEDLQGKKEEETE